MSRDGGDCGTEVEGGGSGNSGGIGIQGDRENWVIENLNDRVAVKIEIPRRERAGSTGPEKT